MLDDSIVRGTTCERIVTMLKEAGATEVHLRISSPPFLWPCYYGTDIPSKEELIACQHTIEDIGKMSNADSIEFLALDNLPNMLKNNGEGYCDACFSGKYPAQVPDYLISSKNPEYCTPIKRL
jgi:amidophosphoribosyltransferase